LGIKAFAMRTAARKHLSVVEGRAQFAKVTVVVSLAGDGVAISACYSFD
jgi:hypothetical protein